MEKEEQNYTEQYAGIIMLRKGRIEDNEVWFGTEFIAMETIKKMKILFPNIS